MKFGVKKADVHVAVAENAEIDESINKSTKAPSPEVKRVTGNAKLSRLIDEDFPFDESQLRAIEGIVNEPYACMTGAAGTGKTTVTKKLVDELQDRIEMNEINMGEYFRNVDNDSMDDDYEVPDDFVPSIALCGFTGRSTQMIKKNFPADWHGNIMTIHRLLAFKPEFYEDWDEDLMEYRKKMRFIPTYTAENIMPWDAVIIDEAGMLGLDLWHQLYAAMKTGCRVYMVGDINQLPPVHGKSIFGFAMAKWPAFELTHIHRQVGKENPIVDNAWRVLRGQRPESGGKFQMIELKGTPEICNKRVRAILDHIKKSEIYDPIRDTVITPINGESMETKGAVLGQIPLNQQLALQFNPQTDDNPRFIIDGGRERKQFAVGDKVMATKNDYEAGITNGMTGIIMSITRNEGYAGDTTRFGTIAEVNAQMSDDGPVDNGLDFTLEDLESAYAEMDQAAKDKKEKKDRGPASHNVRVKFGEGEYAKEITFSTLSEVGSLMTAYVVTCHKMQGGESPVVVIILHSVHKKMLNREWLYTAITRASDKCILLYNDLAVRTAINKQNIKGSTLKDKIRAFNGLVSKDRLIPSNIHVDLPGEQKDENDDSDFGSRTIGGPRPVPAGLKTLFAKHNSGQGVVLATGKDVAVHGGDSGRQVAVGNSGDPASNESTRPPSATERKVIFETIVTRVVEESVANNSAQTPEQETVDGGEISAEQSILAGDSDQAPRLLSGPKDSSDGYREMAHYLWAWWQREYVRPRSVLRLTHNPKAEPVKPKVGLGLNFKVKTQNAWAAKIKGAK